MFLSFSGIKMTLKVCHLCQLQPRSFLYSQPLLYGGLQCTEAWALAGRVACDCFVQGSPADYPSDSVFPYLTSRVFSSCEDCKKEPEELDQALQRQTLE